MQLPQVCVETAGVAGSKIGFAIFIPLFLLIIITTVMRREPTAGSAAAPTWGRWRLWGSTRHLEGQLRYNTTPAHIPHYMFKDVASSNRRPHH
jgi:hypothetical protein